MNINRTSLITLVTLITLVITPAAVAKIYKCDGPDGPIYSDRECGPNAEDVELLESSGLSGVSEEDKSALAEKKLERQQAQSRNQRGTAVNNQNNTYATESAGRWVRGRNRPLDRDKPSTLPVKPRPVAPRKKR
ncbi:hypothetical protein ACFL3I_08890 [Pseudomonadota bacterium]